MDNFIDIIKRGNVGFFFGAGMSRPAGIPVVTNIIENVIRGIGMEDHIDAIRRLDFPFEAYMEILGQYTSIDTLLTLFKDGMPTGFHWLLRHLIENGYVRNVMTTNFDLLLEKTKITGLTISYSEHQFSTLGAHSPNYIKIHGCADNPSSIRTSIDSIVKRNLKSQRKKAIEYFFKDAGLSTIFVMGYSCSDKMDLTPLIRNIKGSSTKIIFINHLMPMSQPRPLDKHGPFEFFDMEVVNCNTDEVINSLCNRFDVYIPEAGSRPQVALDRYFNFKNLQAGTGQLIISHFYFRNSKFAEAKQLLESIVQDKRYSDTVRCDSYVLLLEVYHLGIENENLTFSDTDVQDLYGNLEEMTNYAVQTYKENEQSKCLNNKLGQLYNHRGHFLTSLQMYDCALKSYRMANYYFSLAKNHYRQYQIRNNYGNVYFNRYKNSQLEYAPESVYKSINKLWISCRNYYRNTGYLLEQAINKQNMGELLLKFRPSYKKRIRRYIIQALELYTYLNDSLGISECSDLIKESQNNIDKESRMHI